MLRVVEWSETAAADLLRLDWEIAAEVAEAVKLFALVGIGTVIRWPNPSGPDEYRLYVAPEHRYYASIRYSAHVVYVERVFLSP